MTHKIYIMKKIYTFLFSILFLSVLKSQTCTPTIVASSSAICSGESLTLTATGATSYTWMPDGYTISSIVVSPSVTTTYTLYASSIGCNDSTTMQINVTQTPTVNISPNFAYLCSGTSMTLTTSGATSYSWNPSYGLSNVNGSSVTVTPSVTTTYTIIGANGFCFDTTTIDVNVMPNPSVSFTLQPDATPHVWNVYPTYTGGVGSSTIIWNWGDGNYDFVPYTSHMYANAGTYSICVEVTDMNGCTATYCENANVYRADNANTMVQVNVVNIVTGITQNADLSSLVSVYPNPANDLIKIETNLTGVKMLELFDVNGRKVLNSEINGNFDINATLFNDGVYTLIVKTIDNVICKKIVILH